MIVFEKRFVEYKKEKENGPLLLDKLLAGVLCFSKSFSNAVRACWRNRYSNV